MALRPFSFLRGPIAGAKVVRSNQSEAGIRLPAKNTKRARILHMAKSLSPEQLQSSKQ